MGIVLALALCSWFAGCSGSGSGSGDSITPRPVITGAKTNVEFIVTVFPTEESWAKTFPIAAQNPNCTGAATLSRANFLSAAADFPHFCGSASDETNKQELAAFLANVSLETNGAAQGGTDGGLCFDSEVGCVYPGCQAGTNCCDYCSTLNPPYNTYPACPNGYFGRGALQITNPVNYEEAGRSLHDFDPVSFPDPDFLVKDPEKILEGDTAWRASLNFWMNHKGGFDASATSVNGIMTCHQAIVDHNDFGKTVEIINGNLECMNPNEDFYKKTQWRISYYQHYAQDLFDPSVEPTANLQCAGTAPEPSNAKTRCGADWADANNNCRPCCNANEDCPDEYPFCFGQLDNPTPGGTQCSCGNSAQSLYSLE
jgi:predicted chitinase